MTVICNLPKTIRIEGIEFDPRKGGVTVPDEKIKAVQNSFFFKHYVKEGALVVKGQGSQSVEAPKENQQKQNKDK